MTTMAAIMTRMAAAAGTTKLRFINMASKGLSFSDVSLAGAMVPVRENNGVLLLQFTIKDTGSKYPMGGSEL